MAIELYEIYLSSIWIHTTFVSWQGSLIRNSLTWNIIIRGYGMDLGTIFYPYLNSFPPYQNPQLLRMRNRSYFTSLTISSMKNWLLVLSTTFFPVVIYLQASPLHKCTYLPTLRILILLALASTKRGGEIQRIIWGEFS